jgi:NAD(P)-dependent dehydrogenase (short-subunit alcohol dehydrogenase family)
MATGSAGCRRRCPRLLLAGRVAVVTGAGRGIGRATALELARLGAAVVVNDVGAPPDGDGRDASLAAAVVREIEAAGGRAAPSSDSVAEWSGASRIVATALERFGAVDLLVNNAGLAAGAPLWELEPALFERVVASHLHGTFYCMRAAVPHMQERRFGRIVNLVSRAGIIGVPGNAAYGAGKGGVFGLTNVASRDLAPFGITVNAVNPSATDTRMVARAIEAGRAAGGDALLRAENLAAAMQRPEDVAVLIAALCSAEAARINGQVFFVAKGRIGLFQPLTLAQHRDKAGAWSAEELANALGTFETYPLEAPYG